MKLIYPGVFYKENDAYWIEFPDLQGCQSFGDTIEEIYDNAKEALYVYCSTLTEQGKILNPPSDILKMRPPQNAFVSLVDTNLVLSKELQTG